MEEIVVDGRRRQQTKLYVEKNISSWRYIYIFEEKDSLERHIFFKGRKKKKSAIPSICFISVLPFCLVAPFTRCGIQRCRRRRGPWPELSSRPRWNTGNGIAFFSYSTFFWVPPALFFLGWSASCLMVSATRWGIIKKVEQVIPLIGSLVRIYTFFFFFCFV